MALVGASIGLMFALSLVLAPLLVAGVGLSGLFAVTGALALLGMAVVAWVVPVEAPHAAGTPRGRVADVLRQGVLLRLNFGVFILHTVQMAMWVAVPAMLVAGGLDRARHWQVYLPAVLASFVVMGGGLFPLERRGYLRGVLLGAIGCIAIAQAGLGLAVGHAPGLATLGVLLFVFFCGFNVLEASQPSLVSRLAPTPVRGAALGLYNTLQSVGLFAGGALGGLLLRWGGAGALFATTAALALVWLAVTRGLPAVPATATKEDE
jgi:predicted MFS family arabinose efflux permease